MKSINFKDLQSLYNKKLGKLEAITSNLQTTDQRIKELEDNELTISQASLFLQSLSDTARIQVIEKISGLVTEVLQAVKGENWQFKMVLGTERNQPDLKFYLRDLKANKDLDIELSCGGTIANLVSLALRVALLMKWPVKQDKVLILDEDMKMVSAKDQELAGDFVRKLAEQLGLQIIFVTHSEILSSKAHKTFEVTQTNGISRVEEKTASL